jgi:deoxyribodipyrimidine photo-lyase
MSTSVMVFTRDLRVADNPALAAAAAGSREVLPLFVFDDALLARRPAPVNRLAFLLGALADLGSSLRARGGALVVRRGDWVTEVLAAARSAGATAVHLSDDVSGYAAGRLRRLEREAGPLRIQVRSHPGVTAVEPGTLTPPGGRAYQVFTPYFRRWLEAAGSPERRRPHTQPPPRIVLPPGTRPGGLPDLAALAGSRARPARIPPPGERPGQARLQRWAQSCLGAYATSRDDLAADATSHLSAYLHFGCLSPLAVVTELHGRPGAGPFLRQLAWRDFFHQLLAARPAAAHQDYRDRGDRWRDDPAGLAAWQAGHTGYPVVDAGMRQLAAEGFMPNRARMIVASFLTKDLYLDWRAGAAHFMAELTDGDVAVNQLNWQWMAGTGTDTSSYRVLSPLRQGRRFDPAGGYVRRYVPELAALPASLIHDPDPRTRRQCGYPEPLVDHHQAVARARPARNR